MKRTIFGELLYLAREHTSQAIEACLEGNPDAESRHSLAAHLLLGISLEALANEIGKVVFDEWTWNRIEKCDTPLKWKLLSSVNSKLEFHQGKEPLTTVIALHTVRNDLAHPKVTDLGDEIMLRSKEGTLTRNALPNTPLTEGDTVIVGVGNLLSHFDAKAASKTLVKAIGAAVLIRDHIDLVGLEWLDASLRNAKALASTLAKERGR